MDKKTKEALEESIRHWERVLVAYKKGGSQGVWQKEGIGPYDCALCGIYWGPCDVDGFVSCEGCPVKKRSGKNGCMNTPYPVVAKLLEGELGDEVIGDTIKAIQKEIDFLESLRED